MKNWKIVFVTVLMGLIVVGMAEAFKGVLATADDINRLKNDLRAGRIHVGKTRLKEVRNKYGEASNITDSERKIVYDYGDLKIEFSKKRYWRDWEYDGFKSAAYTDDIDDLRSDLESDELVGKNITITKIRKDYDEPTESEETQEDGGESIYYYGNIKMTFENFIAVKSWRGKNLNTSKKN